MEMGLQTRLDPGHPTGDLPGHEGLAAARGLVVEENPVYREHPVRLTVVDGRPVRIHLGDAVRAPRVERRLLVLRRRCRAEHLRRRRLIDPGVDTARADGLQQPDGSETGDVTGVQRGVERHADMRLRTQVVDLVRPDVAQQIHQSDPVGEVGVVQDERTVVLLRSLVDVVDPLGVEARRAAYQSMDRVPLVEQQLGQVRTVLSGHAGDERGLRHDYPLCVRLKGCWFTPKLLRTEISQLSDLRQNITLVRRCWHNPSHDD